MRNFVICGTSGVGKTFLEEYLEKQNISWQLPKYFDRENRPGERKDKNISISPLDWENSKSEFFFVLRYNGYNYGWKRKDFPKDKRVTLAITLNSLETFMKLHKDFMPILLWVEENNLELLKKRMEERGEKKDKIEERMTLARAEIKQGDEYKKIVMENQGWVVLIKDDKSIFEEVLPRIED